MFKSKFLVPAYYKDFKCKGMDCVNTCCRFWNITLTMDDYNHLSNLDVSSDLREKIDNGVSIFPDATKERYAKIDLSYSGECKLRLQNGYCGLQCELGEENIPAVCRYYPRSPKLHPIPMCSISNSCEWVIEKLVNDDSKMTFEPLELSFYFDSEDLLKDYPKDFLKIQQDSFDILSDRSINMDNRFEKLREYLGVPILDQNLIEKVLFELKKVYSHSFSIRDFLGNDFSYNDKLLECACNKYKDFEIQVEKIMINHMFYMRFPYVNYEFDKSFAYYGAFFVYKFILFILDNNKILDPISFISNFFRVAEHANMYDIINNNINRLK